MKFCASSASGLTSISYSMQRIPDRLSLLPTSRRSHYKSALLLLRAKREVIAAAKLADQCAVVEVAVSVRDHTFKQRIHQIYDRQRKPQGFCERSEEHTLNSSHPSISY